MMRRNDLREQFFSELCGFMDSLYETAEEAYDAAMANVEPPSRCAGVHLHQVQWHNGEPVAVRLYVERNIGEGTATDA